MDKLTSILFLLILLSSCSKSDFDFSCELQKSAEEECYAPTKAAEFNGFSINYYSSGKIHSKGNYIEGSPDGYWTFYYENGFIESEGFIRNDKRDGTWKYFSESGQLRFTRNFDCQ